MGSASTLAEPCITAIPCPVTEPVASEAPALIEVRLSTAETETTQYQKTKDQEIRWEGEWHAYEEELSLFSIVNR